MATTPDAISSLFAQICAITNSIDEEARQQLWECLRRFKVQEKGSYKAFDECITLFISAKTSENLSKHTLQNYKERLGQMSRYFENKPPAEITTDNIRDIIRFWLEERHMKKSSVQTCINYTSSFFGWLYQEEYINSNPCSKIKSFHIDKTAARTPLSSYDLERFRLACETPREKALSEFFISTGCRVSEVTNIKRNEINWAERTIEVVGKGNKKRTIIFSVRSKLYLEEYLQTAPPSEYLFCSSKFPYGSVTKEAIEKIIRNIGKKAGITDGVFPHKLRHTFATNALNAGMNITSIQSLLGHESLATTQIYAKIRKDTVLNEYNKTLN